MTWGKLELETEVRKWLMSISAREQGKVSRNITRLKEMGPLLTFPFSSQLEGKLRELRFHLADGDYRITYYIAPDRRIVLLTVFRKTKQNESREVSRAEKAFKKHVERNAYEN